MVCRQVEAATIENAQFCFFFVFFVLINFLPLVEIQKRESNVSYLQLGFCFHSLQDLSRIPPIKQFLKKRQTSAIIKRYRGKKLILPYTTRTHSK